MALIQYLVIFMKMACTVALAADTSIRPRHVQITPSMKVTIWELAQPQSLVQSWANAPEGSFDPFGLVLWPGAQQAAKLLCAQQAAIRDANVLVLGAGTGLEALTAAQLGAARVLACDINPLSLSLLRHAAQTEELDHIIEPLTFDLTSDDALPGGADVHVYSDLLYAGELAKCVGTRCRESLQNPNPPHSLIVTDSQQFQHGAAFLEELNRGRGDQQISWEYAQLASFTGSGLLIDEDQTYDAAVRFINYQGNR